MHATCINKWSFWNGFWISSKSFSPENFNEWIPLVVPILFSYCTRSHSTPNYTCFWSDPPFNHDQTFKWNSSHCSGGKIILTHKPHFMFSIPQNLCNTFLPTPIWSCKWRWLWSNNPWHQVHPRPSPWPGYSLVRCGKRLQFDAKKGYISKTSCSKWKHHTIHPFCSYILCNWISLIL